MEIIISKSQLYPLRNPRGYAVGFTVNTENGNSLYKEIILSLEEVNGKTEEEIVEIAWLKLKDDIEERVLALESSSRLVGQKWTPPEGDPLEDENEEELTEEDPEGGSD